MLLLVSGNRAALNDRVGHLVVPRAWANPETTPLVAGRWAMDNGAFGGFDPGAYLRMIYAYRRREGCLFVTVPDVVADAAATLELWKFWSPIVRAVGRAPAFVAQNGLTAERVPWDEFGTLFIGGDNAFKEGEMARSLCAYAKARGLWVHWGRVNGRRRYELAMKAGADSIDGSGFSMFPDTNIPLVDEWRADITQQPELEL
jgi:hypothetical protein